MSEKPASKCVVLTRAKAAADSVPLDSTEAHDWAGAIQRAGHRTIDLPLLGIGRVTDSTALEAVQSRVGEFQVLMFVSGNAVAYFFSEEHRKGAMVDHGRHVFAMKNIVNDGRIACWVTGPGSALALRRAGVDPALVVMPNVSGRAPEAAAAESPNAQFDSESLWLRVGPYVRAACTAQASGKVSKGFNVLIVRGQDEDLPRSEPQVAEPKPGCGSTGTGGALLQACGQFPRQVQGQLARQGRMWLAERLQEAGAHVEQVVSYLRLAPRLTAQQLGLASRCSRDGSLWLFSSSQAVLQLPSFDADATPLDWSGAKALATHSRIAEALKARGFGQIRLCAPTAQAVLSSIELAA